MNAKALTWRQSSKWQGGYGCLSELRELARAYYEWVKALFIVLDNPIEDKLLTKRYVTRFDDKYRRKQVARLLGLKRLRWIHGGVMMTLTVQPSRFTSLAEEKRAFEKAVNRLFARLYKVLGPTWRVAVREFTAEGHPHMHVLFLGLNYAEAQPKLSTFWDKYGMGPVVDVRRISERYNLYRYVMKYLSKSMGRDASITIEGGNRFTDGLVLGWALGARSFSFSRNLLNLIKELRITQTQYTHLCAPNCPDSPNYTAQVGDLGGGGVAAADHVNVQSYWEYLGAYPGLVEGLHEGKERRAIRHTISLLWQKSPDIRRDYTLV